MSGEHYFSFNSFDIRNSNFLSTFSCLPVFCSLQTEAVPCHLSTPAATLQSPRSFRVRKHNRSSMKISSLLARVSFIPILHNDFNEHHDEIPSRERGIPIIHFASTRSGPDHHPATSTCNAGVALGFHSPTEERSPAPKSSNVIAQSSDRYLPRWGLRNCVLVVLLNQIRCSNRKHYAMQILNMFGWQRSPARFRQKGPPSLFPDL